LNITPRFRGLVRSNLGKSGFIQRERDPDDNRTFVYFCISCNIKLDRILEHFRMKHYEIYIFTISQLTQEGWIEPDQNIYSNINIFQKPNGEYIKKLHQSYHIK
jgi:hypothetical protein